MEPITTTLDLLNKTPYQLMLLIHHKGKKPEQAELKDIPNENELIAKGIILDNEINMCLRDLHLGNDVKFGNLCLDERHKIFIDLMYKLYDLIIRMITIMHNHEPKDYNLRDKAEYVVHCLKYFFR